MKIPDSLRRQEIPCRETSEFHQRQIVQWCNAADIDKLAVMNVGEFLRQAGADELIELLRFSMQMYCLVAKTAEMEPAGYIIYQRCPDAIEVCRIVVDAPYRGRGIGRKLLEVVRNVWPKLPIVCYVNEYDLAAQLFLRSCGVKASGTVNNNGLNFYRFIGTRGRVNNDSTS